MQQLLKGIIALMIVAGWTPAAECHGVAGSIDPEPGYQVSAVYDDGEPMSYASVKIIAPNSKIAFQSGRTDRNGVMMFQPDQPGLWRAVVSDSMGHRLAVEVEIAAEEQQKAQTAPETKSPVRPGGSRIHGVVTGLALIFGCFGFAYGWFGRRQVRSF